MRSRMVLLALLAFLGACRDDGVALLAPPVLLESGVQAYLIQEAGSTSTRVVLTVRVDSKDINYTAYQGRLEFIPGSFEVLEASTPVGDGYRVVNTSSAAIGVIRFAGFTSDGFSQPVAVRLVVKPTRALSNA